MAVPRASRISRVSRGGRLTRRRRAITTQAAVLAVLATGITGSVQSAQAAAGSLPKAPRVASVPVHKVTGRPLSLSDQPPSRRWKPAAPQWPAAGSATLAIPASADGGGAEAKSSHGKDGTAQAGELPVLIASGAVLRSSISAKNTNAHAATGQVGIQLHDHAAAQQAGVNGLLLTLTPDADATAGPLTVTVDYSAFKDAYGGTWSNDLSLVTLPGCALTTPQVASCQVQKPLADSHNDVAASQATATATLPAGTDTPAGTPAAKPSTTGNATPVSRSLVVALTATAKSGGAGDYSATPLSPSGTWSAGGNSGDFTYSYPIPVPPSAGGLTPSLSLSYDSQSIDGRLASTDNQAGQIGDGWSMEPSFVSRSYMSCSDDPAGTAPKTGDRCWAGQVLHVSLPGHSADIVQDSHAPTGWRLSSDDNSKVELVATGSATQNGTYDGDYWKITTTDGTIYSFGQDSLPTYGATNSAWTVPVYGAHSGDPCYEATFAEASCQQAWQWNLDQVTDTHGNVIVYHYIKETNYYGADSGTKGVSYTRAGYLDHVDYGLGNGNTVAPQRVALSTADRCVAATCDPITSHASSWPDVPFNLNCESGASCSNHSPSFWTEHRTTAITTGVYDAASKTYPAVDTYALAQSFPDPGDNAKPNLWLDSITRTGGNGSSAVSLPAVTFNRQGLANRYDIGDGYVDLVRYRISGITTETGEQISVGYSSASCKPSVAPSANIDRCFPVYWTPPGQPDPVLDWFNKYVVTTIGDNDATGGAPTVTTDYEYLGDPGWHYDDNEIVTSKYRTWGQWRGYPEVKTRVGGGSDAKTLSDTFYYLGMDGDTLPNNGKRTATAKLSSAVTVPGVDTSVPDDDKLAGSVREAVTYKGDGGPVASATVNSYWVSASTATRTRDGLPALTAVMVRPAGTTTTTAITSGPSTTWRTTRTTNSYDKTTGLLRYVDDEGDTSLPAQETCTSTTYAPANTSLNLLGLPAEAETDQGACATGDTSTSAGLGYPTAVSRPDAVLTDTRTFYDTAPIALPTAPLALPQSAPTKGDTTTVEQATGYAAGAFTYRVAAATAFDAYGRATDTWGQLGATTQTAYSTAAGQTTGEAVTNAKDQTSTTTFDAARGLVTSTVDANGARNDTAYDALGRTTGVWGPGRDKATQTANTTYSYVVSAKAPSAVTTKTLNEDGTYTTSVALYDALLRSRQTQSQTPAGGRLLTDTYYDTRGWAWKTNSAYWDGGSVPGTDLVSAIDPDVTDQDVITFDGLGRAVLDVSKDKGAVVSQTQTVYGGDRTTVIPPDGGTPTTTVTDARGRTVANDSYASMPSITGDQVTGGSPLSTTFAYDNVGDHGGLDTITDPGGNKRTYGYDLLGEKTSQTDPDTGATSMTYDAAGQLKTATDAKGNTLSYDYDVLGRKTGEHEGAGDSAPLLASWTYDDPAVANSIGQLTASTRYVTGTGAATDGAYTQATTGFDVLGDPTGSKVTLPSTLTAFGATSFSYKSTYTTNVKLPLATTYPAGGSLPTETVTASYLSMGLPTSIGGLSTYTSATTYDAYARVSQTTLGKLTVRNLITNAYDEHTGTLNEATATRSSDATNVDDTSYRRDLVGNVTRITDIQSNGAATDTQCYGYDMLGRMTQAWSATDACTGAPSTGVGSATVGGPNPYWTSWTFDDDGNRTTQTEHSTTASTADTTSGYSYGKGGDATKQPDTMTALQVTGPGSTTAPTGAYTYDASGNTATTPDAILDWDAEGHLDTLKATTSANPTRYIYDADGNQLLRVDPSGTLTLFLPGQELTSTAGTVTGYRTIALPGGAVAERYGAGANYSFVLNNDQGTGTIGLNNTAQTASFRPLTPYGAPRATAPTTWHDDKGLVGGTTDSTTGLTNLGAREYDPLLGRFISADPLLTPADPNQIGGYTYSSDSPVTLSDPSGLRPLGPSDGGTTGDYKWARGEDKIVATGHYSYYAVGSQYISGLHGWIWKDISHFGVPMNDDEDVHTKYIPAYHKGVTPPPHTDFIPSKTTAWDHVVGSVLGIDDAENCFEHGSISGCAMTAANFVPGVDDVKAAASVLKGVRDAEEAADAAKAAKAAKACLNSFDPNTEVLTAEGKSKPIKDLKVGDDVRTGDPTTGKSAGSHKITATMINHDDNLVDVTITTTDGHLSVLHTTTEHPFWDDTTHKWVNAADLIPGHALETAHNTHAYVADVHATPGTADRYNLTVDQLHTYYVLAGSIPVLVHNACKTVAVNDAGRFGDLNPGQVGDSLEAHHMPQDGLGFLARNEGGAIVMTQADHALTRTYKSLGRATKAAESGLPFRTVLARDIWDLRRIGQQQYGDPGYFNPGIQGLLAYYRRIGML